MTVNSMSRSSLRVLRAILGVLTFLMAYSTAHASATCAEFTIQDVMPVYPPIARAAHVEGIVKLQVTIDANRQATVELIDGPRMVAGAAEDFILSRRYAWNSASLVLPCGYAAEVEYRMIP